MASEISSSSPKKKTRPGFMTLLSSALCEWFLIALLFLEASLSYLLNQFARYCDLKTPCPLCSTLSSGNKKLGCFYSLLCLDHKEEVSSVTSCSVHNKLADVNNMCEECLSPLAMQKNGSSSGSYRLFLGKVWVDIDKSVLQNLVANKYIQLGSLGRGTCSCCNRTWRAKTNADRLMLDLKAVGLGASRANVKPPLPRVPGRSRFSRRDSMKRLREKITVSPLANKEGSRGVDTLSHVGYTKLKLGSDTESEFPFSEDDDDDNDGRSIGERVSVRSDDDFDNGPKISNRLEKEKPFVFDQPDLLLDLSENDRSREDTVVTTAELITIDEVSQAPHVPQSSALSALTELLSLQTDISSSDIAVIRKKIIADIEVEPEPAMDLSSDNEAKELESDGNNNPTDDSIENKESVDLPFEKEVERMNAIEYDKIEDNLLPLEQQEERISAIESDNKIEEDSESYSSRNDAEVKSQTVSSSASPRVNDSEGENSVEDLKKQVEHYQSCMNSLYKELEEERSAAAIAANEAMAMITRLQEEKAALHMEALQYLRMMEEQAQYDTEALERANDLLSEREKELQDLEAELEFYRDNLNYESGLGEVMEEDSVLDNRDSFGFESVESARVLEDSRNEGVCDLEDSPAKEGTSLNVSAEDDIEIERTHRSNENVVCEQGNGHYLDKRDEFLENANPITESKEENMELED